MNNLKYIADNIIPKLETKSKKLTDEDKKKISKAMIDYGIENNISLYESFEGRYSGMMINLRKELIEEFNCTTYSEKALVDMIVGAYARNLTYSKQLLSHKDPTYLSHERNGFLSLFSKEIDRANRHFITALSMLKQMREPQLNLNVKAKNAFVAQNQQLNNINQTSNESPEKNIKPT